MATGARDPDASARTDAKRPDVSILIVAYGRRQYVRRAIASIQAQNLQGYSYEIVVLTNYEDSSLLDGLSDPDVRVISLREGTVGEYLARGVQECSAEIICFLDDDDAFVSGKISWVASNFKVDPTLVYLHNAFDCLRDDDSEVKRLIHRPQPSGFKIKSGPRDARQVDAVVRCDALINLSSISLRRSVLVDHLADLAKIRGGTDYFMFYAALNSGGALLFAPDRLTIYYIHASAMRPAVGRSNPGAQLRSLAEENIQTQSYALGLPEESGAIRVASAIRSEYSFLLAIVTPVDRRTLATRFLRFVRLGWGVRQKLILMASPLFCATLISPTLGENFLFTMRRVIQD
jgi:glycosyltransferase involved in cell wall biosynthesis